MVAEKLFLRGDRSREDEILLLVSEDINAKCIEVESRLQLGSSYFPFIMQLLMRVLNKGLNSISEAVFPELRDEFDRQSKSYMTNFCESLYKSYFLMLKRASLLEAATKDKRNLELFHYKQADKDKVLQELSRQSKEGENKLTLRPLGGYSDDEGWNFKVYLPVAEQAKVNLGDIGLLFRQMNFEHHQRFILSYYNWHLNLFIQQLVDKFKDDIHDFSMNNLKKNLGFKDVLKSDYSFSRFMTIVGLPGDEEENRHLPRDEFLKFLSTAYSQLGGQLSSLPIESFKEDKYVKIGENCSIVLNCFAKVKAAFSSDFDAMLSRM
jgi:hypothetical protein